MDNWKFNVPVGLEEPSYCMQELMELAQYHAERHEWEACRIWLERASLARYKPAMLALAKLLMDIGNLKNSQEQHFRRCERLLLELERLQDDADIALALSRCYAKAERPAAAYGYLLKAKRKGAPIEVRNLASLKKALETQSLDKVYADVRGCRILGQELCESEGPTQRALFYWEETAENDSSGIAALELADFLNQKGHFAEANHFYHVASQNGCADVLNKHTSYV